jgi:hypothetical protein
MPKITDNTRKNLKDPVGAIARKIERDGNDFTFGKPSELDFVIWSCEILGIDRDDDRDDAIAEAIYQDAGEKLFTAELLAAFIYSRLTV